MRLEDRVRSLVKNGLGDHVDVSLLREAAHEIDWLVDRS
jgi:hypothetical protein